MRYTTDDYVIKDGFYTNVSRYSYDTKETDYINLLFLNKPDIPTVIGINTQGICGRAFCPDMVQNVEFLPKQNDPKVVKMTFYDGTVTTAVDQEGDEFNAEYGMSMCILKYIWRGSGYNTFFRKWMKVDKKRKADDKAAKVKAEQDAERARRKKEKNDARRAKKEAEEREDLIDIIASAIKKASGKKDK